MKVDKFLLVKISFRVSVAAGGIKIHAERHLICSHVETDIESPHQNQY
jgi:hypothetical protein